VSVFLNKFLNAKKGRGAMGTNVGAGKLLEAYHCMTADAAEMLLATAQIYAERYPRPFAVEDRAQVAGVEGFENVEMVGDVSPCGMCVVRWSDRRITWSNNAYRQHFVDLEQRQVNIGMRIDEVVPSFTESGLEGIFVSVAETGQPFHAEAFRLMLPTGQLTYWDWSLKVLPTAAGDDLSLLVQMHRAFGVELVGAA
jgi:hypothetical protein